MLSLYRRMKEATNDIQEETLVEWFNLTQKERMLLAERMKNTSSRNIQRKLHLKKAERIQVENCLKEKIANWDVVLEKIEAGEQSVYSIFSKRTATALVKYMLYAVADVLNEPVVLLFSIPEMDNAMVDEIMENLLPSKR